MIGPLTQLRIVGSICPCALSTDESLAKSADSILTQFFSEIQWHQKSKHFQDDNHNDDDDDNDDEDAELENQRSSSSSSSFGGIFSKISSKVSAVASSTVSRNRTIIVHGSCRFVDAGGLFGVGLGSGKGIALEIRGTKLGQLPRETRQSAKKQLVLPLRTIGSVGPYAPTGVKSISSTTPTDNIISIRGVSENYDSSSSQGEELARIEITRLGKDEEDGGVMGMTREDIMEHMKHILEWDRARRLKENEDDGEIQSKGGLRGRAQKAAHFAKREIELQTTRREREQRKAKYLKESGGLKYTALAMARQQG